MLLLYLAPLTQDYFRGCFPVFSWCVVLAWVVLPGWPSMDAHLCLGPPWAATDCLPTWKIFSKDEFLRVEFVFKG